MHPEEASFHSRQEITSPPQACDIPRNVPLALFALRKVRADAISNFWRLTKTVQNEANTCERTHEFPSISVLFYEQTESDACPASVSTSANLARHYLTSFSYALLRQAALLRAQLLHAARSFALVCFNEL
jgi:hypothetical protein